MQTKTVVIFLITTTFLFDVQLLRSKAPTDRRSKYWNAQWITSPGTPQRDEIVLHFKKVIELSERPQHFYVDVSADNQFVFHVNQQRAGNGPSRGDLGHWRYETYDLAPLLHPGKNVLAATVWNFGTRSAIAQVSDRVGFLVHGHGDAERAADTDASWSVEEEEGINAVRPQVKGYFASDPGERLDGSVFDWSWDSGTDFGASWQKAVPIGRGSIRGETDSPNRWQLVSDPLPPIEMRLVSAGRVVRAVQIAMPPGFPEQGFTVPAHVKASILIDNSTLTTGYPALSASEGQGSTIRMTYAEALFDDAGQKGNRNLIEGRHIEGVMDEFVLSGGSSRELKPLSWRTWRYLQIDVETANEPVRVEGLKTWFSAFPFVQRASFSADDESLHSIWDIGWRTARLDAHDTYMDTPYWERLQYIGDTRIQALISYAVAGDDRLARQAIEAFNDSRVPDGITQSRYPSNSTQFIPPFSLLWIGMLHDFWLYRGDIDFVQLQLPGTRTVLDWFLGYQRRDGLLARLPWWPFVDWAKDFDAGVPPQDAGGGSAVITLQFIEALNYAAELETAYGDRERAAKYRAAAARAVLAIRKLCWNQKYGLIADTPAQIHYSQHANILAVWLDVVPKPEQKAVLTKILSFERRPNERSTGELQNGLPEPLPPMSKATYYFRFYLARAIEHAGMGETYLSLLQPWRDMAALGLTTWAETPEPTRSDSHAWSAHPNFDLLTIVAGIRPKTSGFRVVTIEPHLGALHHLSASVPSPNGEIAVEYTREKNGVEATIHLPPEVAGDLIWNGEIYKLHSGEQKLALPK